MSGMNGISMQYLCIIVRLSQAVLHAVYGVNVLETVFFTELMCFQFYVRSTRTTLDVLFNALAKGTDPDRMKGALKILGDKGTGVWLSIN